MTVRQVSAAHEGRPHTDSASKVATLLLYMHPGWAHPAGRIRVLRGSRWRTLWPRFRRRRATSSPSCAASGPGTAIRPSSGNAGWCRWPGCGMRRRWGGRPAAASWPGG
ncbi:hypothetical protein [Dankookia sp. P2]|uniref:hypothetical protein n=1 Tax=Dankookia sp. P2 TaxID=3423955 RepID=UPI003D67A1E6